MLITIQSTLSELTITIQDYPETPFDDYVNLKPSNEGIKDNIIDNLLYYDDTPLVLGQTKKNPTRFKRGISQKRKS